MTSAIPSRRLASVSLGRMFLVLLVAAVVAGFVAALVVILAFQQLHPQESTELHPAEPRLSATNEVDDDGAPSVDGFVWLRKETYSCGGQTNTANIYRCEAFAEALELEEGETDIVCEFVLIPGGEFLMGSDHGDDNEKPVHRVTLSRFLLARTEVTQRVWLSVMGSNPSTFKDGTLGSPLDTSRHPVESVSWEDVCIGGGFLLRSRAAGLRLPTEAEWEYACRAGTTTPFSFGDIGTDPRRYAWCINNSGRTTHPVGKKLPNAFGLYDIHGNVWERCQDSYHESYSNAPKDGKAWVSSGPPSIATFSRVCRGGSWNFYPRRCRSASRIWHGPRGKSIGTGFRPARSVD